MTFLKEMRLHLKDEMVTLTPMGTNGKNTTESEREEIRRLHVDEGLSLTQVSALCDRSLTTVKNAILSAGGEITRGRAGVKAADPNKEQRRWAEMYRNGMSAPDVSEAVGVPTHVIRYWLKRQGVVIRADRGRGGVANPIIPRSKWASMYESDMMSTSDIALAAGVSSGTVGIQLRKDGVELRKSGPKPKDRAKASDGYFLVKVDLDDPILGPMARKGGGSTNTHYVLEHRAVMAEKLGRPMLDHETVHHVDGDRGNNHPDNLELRIGKHGVGATGAHCSTCSCFEDGG